MRELAFHKSGCPGWRNPRSRKFRKMSLEAAQGPLYLILAPRVAFRLATVDSRIESLIQDRVRRRHDIDR